MADRIAAYMDAATQAGSECLAAALDYLAREWSPLCLCPPDHVGVGRGHKCSSPGKRPIHLWDEFQDRRATEDEVRLWWKGHCNANVGIALGPVSGLVGIDVDDLDGELLLIEKAAGDLPATLEFRSGGGGRRLLYRIPPGAVLRPTHLATEKKPLSLLAYGIQTAMPPSRHTSGQRYAWAAGKGPSEIEAAMAPGWLVEELSVERRNGQAAKALQDGEVIPLHHRNTTLASMAGTMRRRGFSEDAMFAALSVENDRCDPPLAQTDIRTIAHSIARYTPDAMAGVTVKLPAEPLPDLPDDPLLVQLATVEPEIVRWLWPLWLADGSLAVLDGDPGLGKSTLTLDLASRISTGRLMPPLEGTLHREPAGVLWMGAEDSLKHTVRPRLDAMGADSSRIYAFEGVRHGEEDRPPVLPWDLELLAAKIVELQVKLIIIDPLMAFLGTEYDAHKDQDIRRCLRPMCKLAESLDVCILLLRHLNKLSGGPALYRGGSSIGITGAARTSLIVGRDPEEDDRYILAMNKTNLGPRPTALAYRIEAAGMASRIVWEGESDLRSDQILGHGNGAPRKAGRPPDAINRAIEFLREVLGEGQMAATEVNERASELEISVPTLRRARETLEIVPFKDGSTWYWKLPSE